MLKKIVGFVFIVLLSRETFSQVTPHINSGDPNFPFPQFLDYGPDRKTLASHNAPGVTHAEMEQRTREAWKLVCNNTSSYPNTVVSGVQYLYPTAPKHCSCVEGDGYYLLGAALMGDKTYFDGYYMWAHDRGINGAKRFIDGQMNRYNGATKGLHTAGVGFRFSMDPKGGSANDNNGNNSAADGDEDFALALLIAYKQWGEHSGIILSSNGWNGKEINYKEEALNYIKAMVDTSYYAASGNVPKFLTGIIGLDGYLKAGDFAGELTDWASNGYRGIGRQVGSERLFADYMAPAWFRNFKVFLEEENQNEFLINQYRRAEASSDWLMGLHYSKSVKNIPVFGHVESAGGNDFVFKSQGPFAEDFRASWRTIMNYVWHGNPTETWNPTTHELVVNAPNKYEYDMGRRFSLFLKSNQDVPWNNSCKSVGDLEQKGLKFMGPYTLRDNIQLDGTIQTVLNPDGSILSGGFPLNWIHGAGAGSAITGQDFDLMGDMFRHCVVVWDGVTGSNLDSRPIYFHEWYRLAGMLTLAGNFHSPMNMIPKANLKVYHKVDKTYAFTGDEVTFTISYRNYGKESAKGTKISFAIPKGFSVANTTGTPNISGDSIVWKIQDGANGTIGFKTNGLAATMDSVKVTFKIGPEASGRYCTNAHISWTGGVGWTSNEYPNNQTTVMERNCVDIVKRALRINKTADRKEYNPGQEIKYKVKFENSVEAGWINGGRYGVNIAMAIGESQGTFPTPAANQSLYVKLRVFHDAAEPYIDYGNYRFSYFSMDPTIKCFEGATGCPTGTGWKVTNDISEGYIPQPTNAFQELITPGQDKFGKWNQRIVFRFPNQLATISQHLQHYAGGYPLKIHEGASALFRGRWGIYSSNNGPVDWTDDWSYDATALSPDDGLYFPIGDDYTNIDSIPVTSWSKSACIRASKIIKNVLVEEWDGYTWRRAFGNGPLPGRDLKDVEIRDTLPIGVTFKSFIKAQALDSTAKVITIAGGRSVIIWKVPAMQVNRKDSILYIATVSGSCPNTTEIAIVNKAWIKASTESPIYGGDTINVTCARVAICPTTTTMSKTSDKSKYEPGDKVKYTIGFRQTLGSIVKPVLNSSTDWKIQSGNSNNVKFGVDGVTLLGINNKGESIVITQNQSYGTNTVGNGIEGIIKIRESEGKFAFVVRHTGGNTSNGVYILINPGGTQPGNLTLVSIYAGTNLTQPLYTHPNGLPFANTFNFRVQLNGPKISIWLVPDPGVIDGAPQIEFTGIPVQSGYAGIAHGVVAGSGDPYGIHILHDWKAHMESAFNTQVIDSIPNNITIDPTSITSSGVLSSDSKAIIWNLMSPLAYNDSVTLTWEGTYKACEKTTNIAYVNTRGITGNQYGVCHDITCGTAPTCTRPTQVTLNDSILEAGGTKTLRAFVSPLKADYIYNWYRVYPNNMTRLLQTGVSATYTTLDTGRFVVRVADIDTADAQCYRPSNIVRISYGCSLPTISVASAALPASGPATLEATFSTDRQGLRYTWYKLPDLTTPVFPPATDKKTLSVTDTGRYQVKIEDISISNCSTLSNIAIVSSSCVPPVASITNTILSYCANTNGLTLTVRQVAGADYQWFKGNQLIPSAINNTLANADSGTYKVRVGIRTCADTSDPVRVRLIPQPLAKIDTIASKLKYCVGSNWYLSAKNAGTGSTYLWMTSGIPQEAASTDTAFTPSTVFASPSSWRVITSLNGCSDTSTAVTVEEVQVYATNIEIQADRQEACIGTLVNVIVTSKTDGTIRWYQDGIEQQGQTGTTYSFTFARNTKVQAVLTTTESCADPKTDTAAVTINQNMAEAALDLFIEPALPICEGQTVTFTAKTSNGIPSPGYVWTVNGQTRTAVNDTLFTTTTLKNGDVVKVSTSDACISAKEVTDTVTVRLNPAASPSVALRPVGALACQGQTVTFRVGQQSGQGASPDYAWLVNNIQKAIGKADSFQLDITTQTEVYVKLISDLACASPKEAVSTSVALDVTQAVNPSITIASGKAGLCPEDNTTEFLITSINGEGSNPIFKWYLNGSLIQTGERYASATLVQGDVVFARLISSLECRTADSADSEPITYMPPAPVTLNLYNNVNNEFTKGLCKGVPTLFEVQYNSAEPLILQWYVNSELQQGELTANILSGLNNGDTVRVKAVAADCPGFHLEDWMLVNVDDKPLETFTYGTGNINLCKEKVIVTASENNPAYTYVWFKDRQEVGRGFSLNIEDPGIYRLEITNGYCTVRPELTVQKPTLNVKVIADPMVFVPGELVKLDAALNNPSALTTAYNWSANGLIQPSDIQQTSFYPMETMYVKVRVTSNEGCLAEDSVQLTKTNRLFIPNALTPETGDQNAFWNIRGTEAFPELEVRVFNRWGSLVHEQKGYFTPWDGTLNGKPLPTGTYYYVLKDKKFDQPKVGDLTLIR